MAIELYGLHSLALHDEFKSERLHDKHVVATLHFSIIQAFS
jgi:hypothetical protein